MPVDLAYGLAFHEGAEILVMGGTLEAALKKGKEYTDQIVGITVDLLPQKDEYYALLYGHLRALSEAFLPAFFLKYEVLLAETETVMGLSPNLVGLFRNDLVVRSKADGLAYNVEWKTDSYPADIHTRMEFYLQLLLETKAASNYLKEHVHGTIIIAVDKGGKKGATEGDKKVGKTSGERRISPLTYTYHKDTGFRGTYSYGYKSGRDWSRVPTWTGQLSSPEWWDILTGDLGFAPLELFCETPPVTFDSERFASVERQLVGVEGRIGAGVRAITDGATGTIMGDGSNSSGYALLDEHFPQNFQNCKNDGGFKKECPMTDICFRNAADDPLKWGYRFRQPNHPLEETIKEANESN